MESSEHQQQTSSINLPSSACDLEIIFLDKEENFVMNNSNKNSNKATTLDLEFENEINSKQAFKDDLIENFRTEKSCVSKFINMNSDHIKLNTGDDHRELSPQPQQQIINQNNRYEAPSDESTNDMSNSSTESATSLPQRITKTFPEFFIKKPQAVSTNVTKKQEIDLCDEQIPFLEKLVFNQTVVDPTPTTDSNNNINLLTSNIQQDAQPQFNNYEFDENDEIASLNFDSDSEAGSINNLEPSIFESNLLFTELNVADNNDLLQFVDPVQFSQEDDRRLVNLLAGQTNEDEITIILDKHQSMHGASFEVIIKKVALMNNLTPIITANILVSFRKGNTSEYISRYEQHFNYRIETFRVAKVINDYKNIRNVYKLRNLKRLVMLSKKNRFDRFGEQLLSLCDTYESLAMVFYLYFQNTRSDVYMNDEMAAKILANKQKIDFDHIPNTEKDPVKLDQIVINMLSHFLSKNDKLINFLFRLKNRPTFTVKLCISQSPGGSIAQKFAKWIHQTEIRIDKLSPVDALEIMLAEELNYIELEFDLSKIKISSYRLFWNYFSFSDAELLKRTFNHMWSTYFTEPLASYFRYEMKNKSKKVLKQNLELMLRSRLLKRPAINRTILCFESIGGLFSESLQYGLLRNDEYLKNECFESVDNEFDKFLIDLYKKYRFTDIIFTNNYFSFKLLRLIDDCFNRLPPEHRTRIERTVLMRDNKLIETMDPADKVNLYLEKFFDPLRHWIKFQDHMTINNCEYFHLIRPYFQELLTELFYRCVSLIPVDVNVEASTLKFVNGLNETLANNIIEYRNKYSPFYNRLQLKRVPGITDTVFKQCIGFLVINKVTIRDFNVIEAELLNAYDSTIIHPDMYDQADIILDWLGVCKNDLGKNETIFTIRRLLRDYGFEKVIEDVQHNFQIPAVVTKIVIDTLTLPLRFDYRNTRTSMVSVTYYVECLNKCMHISDSIVIDSLSDSHY